MTDDSSIADDPIARVEKHVQRLISPFEDFISDQKFSSILLVFATVIAITIANSSLAEAYENFKYLSFGFVFESRTASLSLEYWINDGLMALFFFLLGIEIKREVLVGEISQIRTLLPVAAGALGGMLIPAIIFIGFNYDSPLIRGWGIPMATDAAFAIGILALLGKRIPTAAFVFLTALAIIDDLGAILVIALFYSESLNLTYLGLAGAFLGMLVLFNILGIRRPGPYFLVGILVWVAFLQTGIHATIAGILVAWTVPARPQKAPNWFARHTSRLLQRFVHMERKRNNGDPLLSQPEQLKVVEEVQLAAEKTSPPLRRWERAFERPVALFIIPIFALMNAGVPVAATTLPQLFSEPLALGIILGLVLGKCLGVTVFTWIALKLQLGALPEGLQLAHIVGLGLLAGMGFTMSIFITGLSFSSAPDALVLAKTAILFASLVAGAGGYLWLRFVSSSTESA